MSEEMKLLRALCDALGFDVVVTKDYMPITVDRETNKMFFSSPTRKFKTKGVEFDINDDGLYTSILIDPIISYRLERKPTPGYLLREQAE